jgi:hypothetical protein
VRAARAAFATGALAATLVAAGCGSERPSPPWVDPPTGVVRFVVAAGSAPSPGLLEVGQFHESHNGGTEVIDLAKGRDTLELWEGRHRLWIGSGISPRSLRQSGWVVPEFRTVEVRAGAVTTVEIPADLPSRKGGVVRVAEGGGIHHASRGRIPVTCIRGAENTLRWTCVGRSDDDWLWPPLPPGEWALFFPVAPGRTLARHVTVELGRETSIR